jgi:hypothetical protein
MPLYRHYDRKFSCEFLQRQAVTLREWRRSLQIAEQLRRLAAQLDCSAKIGQLFSLKSVVPLCSDQRLIGFPQRDPRTSQNIDSLVEQGLDFRVSV